MMYYYYYYNERMLLLYPEENGYHDDACQKRMDAKQRDLRTPSILPRSS